MAFASNSGGTRTTLSEINVTPLVDVVLVLLIIFMVTAPILQTGIEVNLPRTKAVTAVNPERQAVVTIGRGDILYYRSDLINFNELGQRLAEEVQPGETVFLQADEDVRWRTVATVLTEINESGYEGVSLVMRPLSQDR